MLRGERDNRKSKSESEKMKAERSIKMDGHERWRQRKIRKRQNESFEDHHV
jgi:hypothetical protein